jgi:hypothetical protein
MASRFVTLGATLIATVLTTGPSYGVQDRATGDVLQQFDHGIADYMTLRRAMERHVPALEVTADAARIHEAVEMRAAAIRRARATARVGDIFAPAVTERFRAVIRRALAPHDELTADLLLAADEDGETPPPPKVNGRFSWWTAIATPACVLVTLPPLPEELQYRFVGRDLVLVDIEANLIVDVLPEILL